MRHAKGHRTTAYAIEQRRESGGYEARKVNPFGRVARHCMTTRQYLTQFTVSDTADSQSLTCHAVRLSLSKKSDLKAINELTTGNRSNQSSNIHP